MSGRRFTADVQLPVSAEVAFRYLVDPRNRPEWQSSLRSVEVPSDEEPHLGQTWLETTSVGVRPRMETTALTPFRLWTERGTWRGVTATLTLHFTDTAAVAGSRVHAEGEIDGRGPWAAAAATAGLFASTAISADLRKAACILAERAPR